MGYLARSVVAFLLRRAVADVVVRRNTFVIFDEDEDEVQEAINVIGFCASAFGLAVGVLS